MKSISRQLEKIKDFNYTHLKELLKRYKKGKIIIFDSKVQVTMLEPTKKVPKNTDVKHFFQFWPFWLIPYLNN